MLKLFLKGFFNTGSSWLMSAIGAGISITKQHNHKACHVILLLSDGNSGIPSCHR